MKKESVWSRLVAATPKKYRELVRANIAASGRKGRALFLEVHAGSTDAQMVEALIKGVKKSARAARAPACDCRGCDRPAVAQNESTAWLCSEHIAPSEWLFVDLRRAG